MTLPELLPMLLLGSGDVGALAQRVVPLQGSVSCLDVDEYLRAEHERTSLLVVDPNRPDRVGFVSRSRFLLLLAGRFGFGRALLGRATVGQVTEWDPVVIDAGATVQQAAEAVLQRGVDSRYDDLVVRFPDGRWGILAAAAVLEALSGKFAAQATTDSLTGLANRDLLLAQLGHSHATHVHGTRTALLFIDLDRFKQVNDVYGHNAGDVLLREIAGRLVAAARPGDLVARLGGDEFAVLLTLPAGSGGDAVRTAHDVAERVLAVISRPVPLGITNLLVGASIGLAVSDPTGSDPHTLLREADLAMYQAKRAGGDRIQLVSKVGSLLATRLNGLAIDDTLTRALDSGEFVLHYQPIHRLSDGQVVSAEALIRWQDPRHGLRMPGEFLPAAEASGLIIALDRWVLAEACRQLVQWDSDPAVTAPSAINVNLSVPHLADPRMVEHVLESLQLSGLAPHRLHLELPETAVLGDLQSAAPALKTLRAAGVKLSLDDLGAGSSTLRHLSAVPLDGIKIDRDFISDLLSNVHDQAVVRLMIELARTIGATVTAEGIETAEQLQILVSMGCVFGQGYHLGRPAPALEAWLTGPEARAHVPHPRRRADARLS